MTFSTNDLYHITDPEEYVDHLDDGRRLAGVFELFWTFAYPALALIVIFVMMLWHSCHNLDDQRNIRRMKPPTSIVQWHMIPQIWDALDGFVKDEKKEGVENREMAESDEISESLAKYLLNRVSEMEKIVSDKKKRRIEEAKIRADHLKRTAFGDTGIDGLFIRKQAATVEWCPADSVLYRLEAINAELTNRGRYAEVTVDDVEDFYR